MNESPNKDSIAVVTGNTVYIYDREWKQKEIL